MTPLDAALSYSARGWRVIPIPTGLMHPGRDGWQDNATIDVDTIQQWWRTHPQYGVGIVTGRDSGIFVLDVDVAEGKAGDETLADLEHEHGHLPATVEAISGRGGRHLYFRVPDGVVITNRQGGQLGPGLDIRGEGGQVLAPPSVSGRPDGGAYLWELTCGPDDLPVAHPPDWLLALLLDTAIQPNTRRTLAPRTDDTPGNRYAATHTWAEMLEADGARHFGTRLDRKTGLSYELWARPGVTDHAGATLYYGGTDLLKVFSSFWPGLKEEETYTRFGYYTATRHGGDFAAATRALSAQQGPGDPTAGLIAARVAKLDALVDAMGPTTRAPVLTETLLEPIEPTGWSGAAPLSTGGLGEPTGWEPVDLALVLDADYEAPQPTLLARHDGLCLIYPGRINALVGESGHGKSWLACVAVTALIRNGEHVIYVDLEDHPRSIADRLRALGASTSQIVDCLAYIRPDKAAGLDALQLVDGIICEKKSALVVLDSMGEAMSLQGLDQNTDGEVAMYFRQIIRRWASQGPAVIVVDHVPKNPDGPRLYAIGSQRKRAAVDGAMYRIDLLAPFSRDKAGTVGITCAKDRNGCWPVGVRVADAQITPSQGGEVVAIRLDPPAERDEATGVVARPTVLMERISMYLANNPRSTGRDVRDGVRGNIAGKIQALKVLVNEHYVTTESGEKHGSDAVMHTNIKPYVMFDDEIEEVVPGGS